MAGITDEQRTAMDEADRRKDIPRREQRQWMAGGRRHRHRSEAGVVMDEALEQLLGAGRPAAEFRHADREAFLLREHPGIPALGRAEIDQDLAFTRIERRLADPE